MANAAVMGNSPFLWEGTDRKGNKIKGKSMAADEAAVRADLRRQGVVPSRIRKQSPGLFRGPGTVTAGDIAIFSRQLATMLSAGTSGISGSRFGSAGFFGWPGTNGQVGRSRSGFYNFMCHGVANHSDPGAASIRVLPVFAMLAGWIITRVDIIVPLV